MRKGGVAGSCLVAWLEDGGQSGKMLFSRVKKAEVCKKGNGY